MDTENPATQGRAVGATPERPTRSRTTWRSRSRWLVHLCLLASVAGAFATLQLLHTRNAIHADVGLVFSGRSLTTWHSVATRLLGCSRSSCVSSTSRPRVTSLGVGCAPRLHHNQCRVSGILDWGRGEPLLLPLPPPFQRWHLTSSAVLVVYLIVHSRAGGNESDGPRSDSPMGHLARGRSESLYGDPHSAHRRFPHTARFAHR
jgi:hypothetical protein